MALSPDSLVVDFSVFYDSLQGLSRSGYFVESHQGLLIAHSYPGMQELERHLAKFKLLGVRVYEGTHRRFLN